MKKLGVIGGAGPLASALFYLSLIEESYRQHGALPEIFLINFPFTRGITNEEGKQKKSQISHELKKVLMKLKYNRAEYGVIVCNTLHLYLQDIVPDFPLFYLPELVLDEAEKLHKMRLLILGSQNTCSQNLYAREGFEFLYPDLENQLLVDEAIDKVLKGEVSEHSAFLLSKMIRVMFLNTPFQGIVLGCTELSVLHDRYPIHSVPHIFDSVKIAAKQIYQEIMEES